MNCKDGKCGIRGGNSTPAQKLEYAPDNSGVRQKFRIGETAYIADITGMIVRGKNKVIFSPHKIKRTYVGGALRFYTVEGLDKVFMQDFIYGISEARQKVAGNPEIYSIAE